MIENTSPVEIPSVAQSPIRKPAVYRLLIIALLAEIAYGVMNLSTMPVYLEATEPNATALIPNGRGFGASVIGLVLVAFLLSEAIFKGPMGHLADRVGPKRLMIFGPALSIGTSILSLFVPHGGGWFEVLCFVLLRAIDGLGAAMLWPAAFSAMGDAVEDRERQQAMSLLNLCYMLGIALALPIGGIANDIAGVKWAGLILASVLFVAVTLGAWLLVSGKHHSQDTSEPHGGFNIGEFVESCRQIPSYLILAVLTFAGIGFPMAIFKLFPIQQFGMSETQIGFLIFPGAIAMGIASVPMSRYGERLGRARAVHLGIGLCVLGLAMIAAGAVVPVMRSPWFLAIGGLPVGIGFLLAIPAWMASVSDIDPKKRGGEHRRGDDRPRSRRDHRRSDRLVDVRQTAAGRRPTGAWRVVRQVFALRRLLRLRPAWLACQPEDSARSPLIVPEIVLTAQIPHPVISEVPGGVARTPINHGY